MRACCREARQTTPPLIGWLNVQPNYSCSRGSGHTTPMIDWLTRCPKDSCCRKSGHTTNLRGRMACFTAVASILASVQSALRRNFVVGSLAAAIVRPGFQSARRWSCVAGFPETAIVRRGYLTSPSSELYGRTPYSSYRPGITSTSLSSELLVQGAWPNHPKNTLNKTITRTKAAAESPAAPGWLKQRPNDSCRTEAGHTTAATIR